MMSAGLGVRPTVNSWLAEFLSDPAEQLRRLLFGRARLGPMAGASVVDAARLIFLESDEGSPALDLLDESLREFLLSERRSTPEQTRSRALAWADGLGLVAALKLRRCAVALRSDVDLWLAWSKSIPITPALDVRAELFTTWALTQKIVPDGSFALESFWLEVCEQAEESYPRFYLAIGLLGLRMLPERPGFPSERAWLSGLLRWAAARQPSEEEFLFEWRGLRSVYPRPTAYWRNAVSQTLKNRDGKQLSPVLLARWRYDVGLNDEIESNLPPDPVWMSLEPMQATTGIIQRISHPITSLSTEIKQHIKNRESYAQISGNSYFLVASACNIGMRLLEFGAPSECRDRGILATELARTTLKWDPSSVYGWALWRNGLAAAGAIEAAELIGWEAIRRFPENEQWRNQLALMLFDLGRADESEALLSETISRFPKDPVARAQLATIYIACQEFDKAKSTLLPAVDGGFADAAVYFALARAEYAKDNFAIAISTIESGLRNFPDDQKLVALKQNVVEREVVSTGLLPARLEEDEAAASLLPRTTARGGRLRKIEARLRQEVGDSAWRRAALAEVRSELAANPHSDYAKYLRAQINPSEEDGGFVEAFRRAIETKDASLIDKLELSRSGRAYIFDVARAYLFKDVHAAGNIINWLSETRMNESRGNAALRHFLELRIGESDGNRGASFRNESPMRLATILAANDNIQRDLIEVAVASLAFPIAA